MLSFSDKPCAKIERIPSSDQGWSDIGHNNSNAETVISVEQQEEKLPKSMPQCSIEEGNKVKYIQVGWKPTSLTLLLPKLQRRFFFSTRMILTKPLAACFLLSNLNSGTLSMTARWRRRPRLLLLRHGKGREESSGKNNSRSFPTEHSKG